MPRQSQGKNRQRIRRELPFRSPQRTVSRASVEIPVSPGTASLVLTAFAPTVSLPVVVTPGKASLTLAAFAPAVATPRVVAPPKRALTLTTFAPSVATPRVMTPATRALILTTFAPTVGATASLLVAPAPATLMLTGYAPNVQGDPVVGTEASGAGTKFRLLRETEIFTGALPFRNLPSDPLPVQAPFSKPTYTAPVIDNSAAFAVLFAEGALTEDEFVVLLAAA